VFQIDPAKVNSIFICKNNLQFMLFCWFPLIEDDFGQERFLIEDPSATFESGNFNRVPVIIGRTEFELGKIESLYICNGR
jgi:hypothetical protein